jgi:predicted esterase
VIDAEVEKYPDENAGRIFIGGLSMGASMALATYLSYDGMEPLGGVISLYGVNPLDWNAKKQSSL